ncbi:MAG: DUF11 domain-containing protein [Caldilineaceae bacterium]|nr:DUF11 domain-containing protein [Caldilineaceae bacterium]
MRFYTQNFFLRYGKVAFYLLLIAVGTFVQGSRDANGQTTPTSGAIVIRKIVQTTGSDNTAFAFQGNSLLGSTGFSLRHNEEELFPNLAPGNGYKVTENVSSSWLLVSATCDDDAQSDPRQGIVVTANEIVTCTFVNQKKGRLVVRKVTDPASDTTTIFNFTTSGGLPSSSFTLYNTGSPRTFSNLTPGSGYGLAETVPLGWVLSSATCDNGSPVNNITIHPGQTVTCTFTNTKLGKLVVRKVTSPNPDLTQQTFPFTVGGGLSPETFGLKNGEIQTFTNLPPGAGYSVIEQAVANWELTKTACSNSGEVTNITIQAGETITCTFTNKNNAIGLTLTKRDGDVTVQPGALLTYTLAYANNTLLPALAVVLTEQVPTHTTFVGPSGWSCTPNTQAGATCTYALGTVAGGGSGQVNFIVRVNTPLPAGVAALTNRATIGLPLLTEVDSDSESTPVNAAPDLFITKSDGGNAVVPGGIVPYTLLYGNQGNQAATGVVLTELIPAHTTVDLANSSAGWDCNNTTCQWVVGTLAANTQAEVELAFLVDTGLPAGVTSVVNRATIADDGSNGVDPTPVNNEATITTPLNRTFQIVATKRDTLAIDADGDGIPSPGDTLEYEVMIRNQSSIGASALVFTDTPDPSTTLLPGIQTSQGTVLQGNVATDGAVEVALGNLAGNGAMVTLRFRVLINAALPPALTMISNQGLVRSPDFGQVTTNDPDTVAENDATRTPLQLFAQLRATLTDYLFIDSDQNDVVSIGDILIYRLLIENTGNGAAGGLQVVDPPNLGLLLVPGSVATSAGAIMQGNNPNDTTVRVEIPLLAAGGRVLISYQMRIGEGVTEVVRNQATVTVESGVVNGTGQLLTDDPDIGGETDVTLTPLGGSLPSLSTLFLPIIR